MIAITRDAGMKGNKYSLSVISLVFVFHNSLKSSNSIKFNKDNLQSGLKIVKKSFFNFS